MKSFGNTDEKEKARKLSEAEKRRLDAFNELTVRMEQEGYRKTELTISIVKANVFAIVFLIPVMVTGFGLFFLLNEELRIASSLSDMLLLIGGFLILTAVHELVHGAGWALFTERRFKDIEFGFMKEYLTPYCTCRVPLKKGQYIFGALMPLVLVGLVPLAAGILTGSFTLLLIGVIMTDGAAGDIMIVWNILRYRSGARDVLYVDHPTQGGGVIFEKQ